MNCIICNKEISKSKYLNAILCSGECYDSNFWNEVLDEDAIIIDGRCYHIGKDNTGSFKGFSGRGFTIQMNNGQVIKTNNLWFNGEVPEDKKIEDNASFVY